MILPMKRINVLAMSYDEKAIMRTLQNIGAVELVQTEYEPPSDDECVRLRNERDRLSHALSVINPYAKKAPLIEILPTLSFEELEAGRQRAYAVIDDIEGAEATIAQAKIRKAQCETKLGSLRPWETLGSSVEELADTRSVRFITGFIRHDRLEKLELPEGAFIRTVSSIRDDAVLIAAHESTLDALGTALRELDFQEYRFPTDMKGSVPDAMNALLGDIAAQKDIIDKANARLLELSDSKGDIKCALDSVCVALEREETALRLGTLGSVFMLDGWIRAEDEELVKNTISGATDTFYFSARDPYDDEEPPTSVRNSKVAEPFESVTNMYSPPAYRGIDAASAITPFYLLFFGMMLADTGYGILLAIGGLLYSKIVRPKGGVRSLAKVMAMCGLSTIVCGLAFGTFFRHELDRDIRRSGQAAVHTRSYERDNDDDIHLLRPWHISHDDGHRYKDVHVLSRRRLAKRHIRQLVMDIPCAWAYRGACAGNVGTFAICEIRVDIDGGRCGDDTVFQKQDDVESD